MFRQTGVLYSAVLILTVMLQGGISAQDQKPDADGPSGNGGTPEVMKFCAIDPVYDDGDGNLLFFCYNWEDTGPFCEPAERVLLWGTQYTKCPDLCSDGCSTNMDGVSDDGDKKPFGKKQLFGEPGGGWDKWRLHPHSNDLVETRNLPPRMKADAGYHEKEWNPRAQSSRGRKAFDIIDAHKVVIELPDSRRVPVSLYNVLIDHRISGNPHRTPDGGTTIRLQYGLERLPDDDDRSSTVIKDGVTVIDDHSLTVTYLGLKYLVVTREKIR
jgi:hypothetical protein